MSGWLNGCAETLDSKVEDAGKTPINARICIFPKD